MTADRRVGGYDFATLLRQRRRAAGLTQAELARLAGLAVRTVREAERGRTSRPQRTTAVLLADALGLTGEERAGFLGAARGEESLSAAPRPRAAVADPPPLSPGSPAPPAAARPPPPLPPPPPLVGREAELGQLANLVLKAGSDRALALVGLAGVGKTALALAVAHRVRDQFPGGTAGVMVDHYSVAAEVLDAVSAGFGVLRHDQLADRLAGAPALLLIDGVDRAPDALRAVLAQLPPTLRVITTGRRPLGVPAERVWPVTPLQLPPAGAGGQELVDVAAYPAAALFLQRLTQVRPEPLAADEVAALVGLVRRLDGLPLALELAAGHGRLLRLPQILRRYGDRVLDLGEELDPAEPENQPLRAAVAGSYRLLNPAEQAALRRLAAFRNRWSVELAEQLLSAGGEGGDAVPLLDRLVRLGMIGVRGTRENRFRMLDVVRDFAIEQAERHGELTELRRAHAVVIARFVGRVAPGLSGSRLPAAVAQLDDIAGEMWAALNHAANDDPPTALRLAAWLPRWWRLRGRDLAGRQWLRRLLDDPRTADAGPVVRAWGMVGVARLAYEHGDGAAERPAAELALAEFRRLGEVAGEIVAARIVSAVCLAEGRYDQAREHCLAALTVATRHGRHRDAAAAQLGLAWQEIRAGELPGARRRLAAVDRLGAQSGDRRLRLLATGGLAEVARLAGRYEEAVASGRRVLGGLAELDPGHRQRALATVGQALAVLGRPADAEQVLARLRGEGAPVPAGGAAAQLPAGGAAPSGGAALAGRCAMIEARLVLAQGDRVMAAEWFTAAVAAFRNGEDARDRLEAIVELVACHPDPAPQRHMLAELERLCREDGFALTERERALLGSNT